MISFSQQLENTIHIAQELAREYHHKTYNAAHLLKALMHKDAELKEILFDVDADTYYIEEWSEVRMENLPKSASLPITIDGDQSVKAILVEAESVLLKIGSSQLTPLSILIATVTPGVGFTHEQLKSLPLTAGQLIEKTIHKSTNTSQNFKSSKADIIEQKKDLKVLDEFCVFKNEQFENDELKVIFGRNGELKTISEILGRHLKPNVLLLGEPGVGKTALLDGFVRQINEGSIPEILKGASVYQLDLINLVSGASYKSEIENRLKKVFNALKAFERPILLIDDIANICEKDNGSQGVVNILKSELSKGEITIVATSTNDAFRKHIETQPGLSRQFEILTLEEPSQEEALTIISNTVNIYSDFHKLEIQEESIAESIRLSKRFTKDRCLPDVAIDLIDRTMSATRYMIETTNSSISVTRELVDNILKESDQTRALNELKWQWYNLKNTFSYLLFSEIEDDNFEDVKNLDEGKTKIFNLLDQFEKLDIDQKKSVDKSDISATIANKTGIPVGKLQSDEKERLLKMESILQQRVIGQDHAVKTITDAILESRSGLSKPGLPIGSFFFTGPTGTGKTELAKSLAEFMFQTEDAIIRFDMSEFKEEHSAALLYGAPPGYVGYEEGGVLVNKIREKPYSIVLFDEIEKAHPSVFDIFLQILDEGKLSDRLGKIGDFSNAVILFTSNIGSEHVISSFDQGIIPKSSDLLEIMGNYFRPEFLGRLTEIVPFAPITKDNVVKIFNIQLKDLHKSLKRMGVDLELTEEAATHLAFMGYTPKYGARPLRGVIRTELRSPLSKKIIKGEITKGNKIKLDVTSEQLEWNIN